MGFKLFKTCRYTDDEVELSMQQAPYLPPASP